MSAPEVQRTSSNLDENVAGFVAEVGSDGLVGVAGGRTRWELGGRLRPDTRVMTAPTGIISYAPEEMTVRVRAGTPVAELHAVLREHGQRTALPERGGTVGGALAVGENDIRALGRGRLRTVPLQIKYVSAEGRLITSGGPTVKNVTGFDLPRLMVGSLGTLGFLAEAILRTNPIPATSHWLKAVEVDARTVDEALIAPSAVLTDGRSTWVQLEGHTVDVDAEHAKLSRLGDFVEVEGLPELPRHRWSVTASEAVRLLSRNGDGAKRAGRAVAVVGLGLVFAETPQPSRPLAPELAPIHERLKQNFDPTGRLNPGRDAATK